MSSSPKPSTAKQKAAARNLAEIMVTADDRLERLGEMRLRSEPKPTLEQLRAVKQLMVLLSQAIDGGSDELWRAISQAAQELQALAERLAGQPPMQAEPAAVRPDEPAPASAAPEPSQADESPGFFRKPTLADPAVQPPLVPTSPAPPVRAEPAGVDETSAPVRPSPLPPPPARADQPPPPRPLPPPPARIDEAPAPAAPPPAGMFDAGKRSGLSPWVKHAPLDERTIAGLRTPFGPTLPFAGPGGGAAEPPRPPAIQLAAQPAPSPAEQLPAPAPLPPSAAADEGTKRLSAADIPRPAMPFASPAAAGPPPGAVPLGGSILGQTASLRSVGRPRAAAGAGVDDGEQATALALQKPAPPSVREPAGPVSSGFGPASSGFGEAGKLSVEQYAYLRAECEVYPQRAVASHVKLGIRGAGQRAALASEWAGRFAQQPTLRDSYEQLFRQYCAWLRQHDK